MYLALNCERMGEFTVLHTTATPHDDDFIPHAPQYCMVCLTFCYLVSHPLMWPWKIEKVFHRRQNPPHRPHTTERSRLRLADATRQRASCAITIFIIVGTWCVWVRVLFELFCREKLGVRFVSGIISSGSNKRSRSTICVKWFHRGKNSRG